MSGKRKGCTRNGENQKQNEKRSLAEKKDVMTCALLFLCPFPFSLPLLLVPLLRAAAVMRRLCCALNCPFSSCYSLVACHRNVEMESLLDVKVCLHCGAPFAFRLSRFGCVFACPCGECIDAVKAAALFANNLRSARLPLTTFVPVLSSPVCDLTSALPVAQVEADVASGAVTVELRNFSSAAAAHLRSCFSLAVRESLRCVTDTRFSAPMGVMDALVDELREAAEEDPQLRFSINAPASDLLGTTARILSSGLDVGLVDNIPADLLRALKKHQLEGVQKALQLQGRILFADDMGVGKTLQAIATVAALRAYPLLILCPSAVKFMWADQVEQFLHEQVGLQDIHIISGANDALGHGSQPKVVVSSYHMAAVLETQFRRRSWQCVVCDESHLLHTNTSSTDATYTRTAIALGQRAPFCLLLSGTPALSSPFDMYNQLEMLRPGLLGKTRYDFALRYCHIAFTPFLHVGASTRQAELTAVLSSCLMLRRLKRDVLELPAKTRVVLRVADRLVSLCRRRSDSGSSGSGSGSGSAGVAAQGATYQERYAASWRAKWSGIVEAVDYCCAKHSRVVLFAHHIDLLDSLTRLLQQRGRRAVRLDGRVLAQQRTALLATFHSGEVQVAVVGVTACAVGISLAPAPCAVFCELPPDGAWMTQAEDRLHRPGQTAEVTIYYLLGVHSDFDAELFARLSRTVREVGSVVAQVGGGAMPLSQVTHRATACLDPSDEAERSAAAAHHVAKLGERKEEGAEEGALLFCLSKNTGRVHVRARDAGAFYTTLPWHEASDCVRQRRSPIWRQLDAFLTSLAGHSPYQQRQIRLSNAWLPSVFQWSHNHHHHDEQSGGVGDGAVGSQRKRRPLRYATVSRIGWGMWWEVRRRYFASHFYFAPLRRTEDAYAVCCLGCRVEALDCNTSLTTGSLPHGVSLCPGTVRCVTSDADLFCSGKCREAFYFKRSSSAIRRTVAAVDRSICANCHVDCEALCAAITAARGKAARLRVVRRLHPQLLEHPVLCERVVTNPGPGTIWQADHIIPVGSGGGEAALENVQTLCVVCHALKTREDMRRMRVEAATAAAPTAAVRETTVSEAARRWPRSGPTRVSWRRLERETQGVVEVKCASGAEVRLPT